MLWRNLVPRILAALADTPVIFLHGARQTGKSTLAKTLADGPYPSGYLTLDSAPVFASAKSDPEGFIAGLQGPTVIDEVQRVPELFRAIKADVDRDRRPGRFLLTGSAHALMVPQLADSLTGRVEILALRPLSQGEIEGLNEGFVEAILSEGWPRAVASYSSGPRRPEREDLMLRILKGGFPEVQERAEPDRRAAWFNAYQNTTLQRDVRDLAEIENLAALPRLLQFLAARSATILNFTEVSRSLALPQTTLKRYFSALEAVFLVQRLPAWSGNAAKRLVKAPKLLLADTGLMAQLLPMSGGLPLPEAAPLGQLLETFVALEVQKQCDRLPAAPSLFHFRTHAGREVDLVIEDRQGRVAGVEVKASATLGADDFKGLKALAEEVGPRFKRGVVLYRGRESLPFGKDLFALPVDALWRLGAKPNQAQKVKERPRRSSG